MSSSLIILVLLFGILLPIISCHGCNEAICASIVSKCMLTQSCKCDLKNTTCSKDCFYCLGYLYTECCSCVEMCPSSGSVVSFLNQTSHVENLPESFPHLFSVLTEEKDRLLRWVSYTFPVQISFITVDKDVKIISAKTGETVAESTPVNCTVAYMSQCMSWSKCKNSCASMGASSYRWFHDGCCECVGDTCINYGINESRCLECPLNKDHMSLEEKEAITDAGLTKYSEENDDIAESLLDQEKEVEKMQNIDS